MIYEFTHPQMKMAFGNNARKVINCDYDHTHLDSIHPLFKQLIEGCLTVSRGDRMKIDEFWKILDEATELKSMAAENMIHYYQTDAIEEVEVSHMEIDLSQRLLINWEDRI